MTAAQRLRAAVNLTADAGKVVSLTAMEALREGAAFIGIVGEQDELIDPFHHLDAPIWARDPPVELLKLAYSYCEELTMREVVPLSFFQVSSRRTKASNVRSLRILPQSRRHCRRRLARQIPGSQGEMDPEAVYQQLEAYKTRIQSCKRNCTLKDS